LEKLELGRRYTCSEELAPLRGESAERVSRRLRELAHESVQEEVPVQEEPAQPEEPSKPEAPVEEAEQFVVDITDLSDTEPYLSEDMVTWRAMTIDRFVPGARQAVQQPPPQSQVQAPPLPPPPQIGQVRKRQRVAKQTSTAQEIQLPRLFPDHSATLLFKSRKPRSGRALHPPPKLHRCGSPSFCWTASHFPQALVYGSGSKVKGAALLRLWRKASFCLRTCTPSKKGRRSLWGEGCSGIQLR